MVANNLCFQAVATVNSMADMRRKAAVYSGAHKVGAGQKKILTNARFAPAFGN